MESDEYFPATFNLGDGPVSQVASSSVDPRVIFDALGIRATDGSGAVLASLNADGTGTFAGHIVAGGVDMAADDSSTLNHADRKMRWHVPDANGAVVVAEADGYSDAGSGVNSVLTRSFTSPGRPIATNQQSAAKDPTSVPIARILEQVDLGVDSATIFYDARNSTNFTIPGMTGILIDTFNESDFAVTLRKKYTYGAGTSVTFDPGRGVWNCEVVFGFARSHALIASAVLHMGIDTGTGGNRPAIAWQINNWSYSPTNFATAGAAGFTFSQTNAFVGQVTLFLDRTVTGRWQ